MTAPAFVSVRGIEKAFGQNKVLHGIDLVLPKGTVTALLGENGAGKSTLVRIIAGDHQADAGKLEIEGEETVFRTVSQSRNAGIRLIAQEIADAPPLSVAENIVLGSLPARGGIVDWKAMRRLAGKALADLGADLPLDARVSDLRLGERQIVEIARATIGSAHCIIFDEPTAALTDAESKNLFRLIERMKRSGVAILYITHRLDEVFAIADQVCVLRDGRVSLSGAVSEVNHEVVVSAMVGGKVSSGKGQYKHAPGSGDVLLRTRALTSPFFENVDLDVEAGEIVGLYGKIGSGVPEFASSIFGASPFSAGEVEVHGNRAAYKHPSDAVAAGVGFLPADRASEGLLPARSAAQNLAAPSWRKLSGDGVTVTERAERSAFDRWRDTLRIRASSGGAEKITTLSGGNQQKVLLGRWLEANSKVMVLVEPTRGVDVGARQEIYQVLRDLARSGHGVLMASSDYEDITEAATRAVVMVGGKIVTHLAQDEISVERLTEAAGGSIHV